ncbi:hypothetical protein [Paenibacillus sp. FSL K6-1318]|uniref:hypothetical protein n=1 Tax=Paenibacillus sp. FSL K6-1318 TaxID=2975291 RepID=UPI0030ECA596
MSITRWIYKDTEDLCCVHAGMSDNTTDQKSNPKQVEYRFQNAAGVESKWHRPALKGSTLTGKAIFPAEISTQDVTKMSQLKLYLNYPPINAYRDGVTHVVCDIKSSRKIGGLKLIYGFLIQADDVLGPAYGNNQKLQWDVYTEPIKLEEGVNNFARAIPIEHIRKQESAQRFQPRHVPFFYWRMEGANTFRPGDVIEFSFRFISQPYVQAKVGVRSSNAT